MNPSFKSVIKDNVAISVGFSQVSKKCLFIILLHLLGYNLSIVASTLRFMFLEKNSLLPENLNLFRIIQRNVLDCCCYVNKHKNMLIGWETL